MLHTESIEVHNKLNPRIWVDEQLRDEVREKLQEIVEEFILELKENNIPINVLDAHIVGSNASYNYTRDSDLDVHIIASFDDVTCDSYILNILYNYFKSYFNDKYDISIHGVPVELYVEDVKSNTVSNGIYSLFNNKWIKFPEPIDVPDVDISDDIKQYENMYHSAVDHNDAMEASQLIDDLYLLRRNSINTDGEYGIGNLIFKEFRNRGWLDNLKEVAAEGKSKQLSLEHLCEALDDIMSMENLIREAKEHHVRPEDLFENDYDYLVDATKFFNYMVYGTDPSYRTSPEIRIRKNRGGNQFYMTLIGFLDSIGTGEDYDKIEPAIVKKTDKGLVPQDGRHRAKLCMLLGIPLPVKVLTGKNECLHAGVYKVLRKDKGGKRFPSSTEAATKAPKSFNEDISSTTDIFNAVASRNYRECKSYGYDDYTADKIVSNIKRHYNSGKLCEDFLDSEEKFWDYKTAPVDGKNIFDENRGESGYARDMIKLAHSGAVNEDGKYVDIVQMSPRQYLEACAEGFGSTFSNQITSVKSDVNILQHLADVIQKYKVRFPITYLDYSYNRFNQEGRHRMYVAGELFGWDTKQPVMIIRTTDEATKAKKEETITRYINKALRRTKQYEFVDLDDIKQQFEYDINYVMDDPKFDVKEDGDNYIFTVNGVSYPEPKSEFTMLEEPGDDEESYDDIDDIDLDLNESVQTNFTIDELKSVYKKFLKGYYKNNPELVNKVYKRVGEEDWSEMLTFFNSIEFPTEVYRGLSKDEVNTSNLGVNWTTDLDLFSSGNSVYKNSKAILKTKVNKDDINWEETISNYIYYSLHPSYGLYPEHELTLKKSPSSDKVEITHRP